MKAVVFDPLPAEVDEYLARRRQQGLDRFDEVHDGVYHMVPAPHPRHAAVQARLFDVLRRYVPHGLVAVGPVNIGGPNDYRIPDAAVVHTAALDQPAAFVDSAVLVAEVVSPGEDGRAKADFYAACGVNELLIVAVNPSHVEVVDLVHGTDRVTSLVLGVTAAAIAAAL